MPRRNAPRQLLTISLKVQIGGRFWLMFELSLNKTPTKEASPATALRQLADRHPAKKFSSHFLICARRFFSSKRKRKLLCGVLLWASRAAGLSAFCIRSGVAEFPPNPPSATPSLGRFFFSAEFEAVPISLVRHLKTYEGLDKLQRNITPKINILNFIIFQNTLITFHYYFPIF